MSDNNFVGQDLTQETSSKDWEKPSAYGNVMLEFADGKGGTYWKKVSKFGLSIRELDSPLEKMIMDMERSNPGSVSETFNIRIDFHINDGTVAAQELVPAPKRG